MADEVEPRFKQSRGHDTAKRQALKRRGTLAPWRRKVLRRDGQRCRLCGIAGARNLSAHHLIFLSHCSAKYETDVRNGLTLCHAFANGCHEAVHAGTKKVSYSVLPPSVVECLAEQGLRWVDGEPVGTLARYFE